MSRQIVPMPAENDRHFMIRSFGDQEINPPPEPRSPSPEIPPSFVPEAPKDSSNFPACNNIHNLIERLVGTSAEEAIIVPARTWDRNNEHWEHKFTILRRKHKKELSEKELQIRRKYDEKYSDARYRQLVIQQQEREMEFARTDINGALGATYQDHQANKRQLEVQYGKEIEGLKAALAESQNALAESQKALAESQQEVKARDGTLAEKEASIQALKSTLSMGLNRENVERPNESPQQQFGQPRQHHEPQQLYPHQNNPQQPSVQHPPRHNPPQNPPPQQDLRFPVVQDMQARQQDGYITPATLGPDGSIVPIPPPENNQQNRPEGRGIVPPGPQTNQPRPNDTHPRIANPSGEANGNQQSLPGHIFPLGSITQGPTLGPLPAHQSGGVGMVNDRRAPQTNQLPIQHSGAHNIGPGRADIRGGAQFDHPQNSRGNQPAHEPQPAQHGYHMNQGAMRPMDGSGIGPITYDTPRRGENNASGELGNTIGGRGNKRPRIESPGPGLVADINANRAVISQSAIDIKNFSTQKRTLFLTVEGGMHCKSYQYFIRRINGGKLQLIEVVKEDNICITFVDPNAAKNFYEQYNGPRITFPRLQSKIIVKWSNGVSPPIDQDLAEQLALGATRCLKIFGIPAAMPLDHLYDLLNFDIHDTLERNQPEGVVSPQYRDIEIAIRIHKMFNSNPPQGFGGCYSEYSTDPCEAQAESCATVPEEWVG